MTRDQALPRHCVSPATDPHKQTGALRLRITSAAEPILRSGHPWLFAESIRDQNRAGATGELAVIYDRNNRFLAVGLFDLNSPIRVRILHCGKPRQVNREFWEEKLERALSARHALLDQQTTGFRWINGESDEWPGLVLDRYASTLVLKLYTSAWLPWLDKVIEPITGQLRPERVVLRLSRNIQEFALRHYARRDGEVVYGEPLRRPVEFLETGLRFEADVERGQKTGFFLDQRENRRKIETLSKGRSILNAFSFSGGFSLYAARGGARSVTDLDISLHSLTGGKRNFELNQSDASVQRCVREAIQADAFHWLASNKDRRFDLIVLDPPSMAKREDERGAAVGAYRRLAAFGIRHLGKDGVLAAASCSAHVSEDEFCTAVLAEAASSRRRFGEICRTSQPPDHPAAFKEARYLKAIYLQFK